jgi:phospholipid/cholesterol/gamma-HCH transport system substrate-binding protein
VRKDSTASILTEGLLGNKYVSISFGSNESAQIEDGDVIRGEPPIDISDLVAKSREALDRTTATMKNVQEASGHFNSVAEKIDNGQGTIGRLVNDRSVYHQMNETVTQAKAGVTAFNEDMQALKKNWFFHGFFKDRGYLDSADISKAEISKLPEQTPAKKFVTESDELFEKPTTADIKDKKLLSHAGEFLQQNTSFKLAAVTAYTGFSGDKERNLDLSRAQAMVVRQFLVENFKIDDQRIKTKGMGEDSRDKYGRIEILVYQ